MSNYALPLTFVVLFLIAQAFLLYPLRKHTRVMLCLVLLSSVLVSLAYVRWGGWETEQRLVQKNRQQQRVQALLKSVSGPQEIISKLRARLRENPTSARGWYLLGRLYTNQGQYPLARTAFAKAHALKPNDEQITLNYAQSIAVLHKQVLDDECRGLMHNVLEKHENQPDALAMLAMDAYVRGAYEDAIVYWQRLLVQAPHDSPEADAIRQAILKATSQAHSPKAPTAH